MVTTDDSRTILDYDDLINRRANQLRALIGHLSGDAGPCFHALPRDMQTAYLATCYELIDEVVSALAQIGRLRLKERDSGRTLHPAQ